MTVTWYKRPVYFGADKPDRIELYHDCCFEIDGVEYWIPAGYQADGASIPAPLWYIAGTPFEPNNAEPGICHDSLYLTHATTRAIADEVLYQLKLQHELRIGTFYWLARLKAWRMWSGVRVGGAFAWMNNREDLIELERMKVVISERTDLDKFKTLWFS